MNPHQQPQARALAALLALAFATATVAAPVQSNTVPTGLDLSAFKIITERNIFDPNRRPSRGSPTRRYDNPAPRRKEYVALVGTMSYEKGALAFFDGASSSYRKAVKSEETIAGYTVKEIEANRITLAVGTNSFQMSVGKELRLQDDGQWILADHTDTFQSGSSNASGSSGPVAGRGGNPPSGPAVAAANPQPAQPGAPGIGGEPGAMDPDTGEAAAPDTEAQPGGPAPAAEPAAGVADPVLQRLMQRRQQEENR